MADQQRIYQVLAQVETQGAPNLRVTQILAQVEIVPPATSYSATISDAVACADVTGVAARLSSVLSEIVSANDATSYGEFFAVLAETLTALDAILGAGTATNTYEDILSDGVSISDAATPRLGAAKLLAEALRILEQATPYLGFYRSASELIYVTDTQAVQTGKLIAEYVRATDNWLTNWSGSLALAERFIAGDRVTAAQGFLTALSEIIANSDAVATALGVKMAEGVAVSEATQGAWQGIRAILEAVRGVDQITKASGYSGALAESIALIDTPLVLYAFAALATEAVAVASEATPAVIANGMVSDSLHLNVLTSTTSVRNGQIAEVIAFDFKVTLDGEVYQCWSFTTGELHPSIFTNYDFTSYTNVGAETYATRPDGIYLLGGATDAGTKIETGVKLNFGNMGTHLQKRLYYADFGLVGESPALRVTTATGTADYYVACGKAKLGMGAQGRDWELTLTDIDALDFVEIAPVVLSR